MICRLYVVNLCTKLDRFCFLAPYHGTYIMTVNADDMVSNFPTFKHFLFVYKNLSDDGKTFPIIPCISEKGTISTMNLITLNNEFFQEA